MFGDIPPIGAGMPWRPPNVPPIVNVVNKKKPKIQHIKQQEKDTEHIHDDYHFRNEILFKITNEKNEVVNSLDGINLELKWDYKTNVFCLSHYKTSSNYKILNSELSINNLPKKYYKFNDCHVANSLDKIFDIYSTDYANHDELNWSNFKTLEFLFKIHDQEKNKDFFRKIIIAKKSIVNYKKDFQIIQESKELKIFIQNGFKLKDENSKSIKFIEKYKSFIFQPIDIKQGQHNYQIANIIHQDSIFERFDFKIKNIFNLPFNSAQFFSLETTTYNSSLIINSNLYYDFESKQTKIGFNENSYAGYVVPYEYYGSFFPYINLDLDIYTNIKIGWKTEFSKPYYFKDKGIYQLSIHNSNEKPMFNNNLWKEINCDLLNHLNN